MKDAASLHLKVQELCDCFAANDPLKEMSEIPRSSDEEKGLKWIALAVLHGINANAAKISITSSTDGNVKVTAEYRQAELPSPGPVTGKEIIQAIRDISHFDQGNGETTLAFGIRNNSMDLQVTSRQEGNKDTVTIAFP